MNIEQLILESFKDSVSWRKFFSTLQDLLNRFQTTSPNGEGCFESSFPRANVIENASIEYPTELKLMPIRRLMSFEGAGWLGAIDDIEHNASRINVAARLAEVVGATFLRQPTCTSPFLLRTILNRFSISSTLRYTYRTELNDETEGVYEYEVQEAVKILDAVTTTQGAAVANLYYYESNVKLKPGHDKLRLGANEGILIQYSDDFILKSESPLNIGSTYTLDRYDSVVPNKPTSLSQLLSKIQVEVDLAAHEAISRVVVNRLAPARCDVAAYFVDLDYDADVLEFNETLGLPAPLVKLCTAGTLTEVTTITIPGKSSQSVKLRRVFCSGYRATLELPSFVPTLVEPLTNQYDLVDDHDYAFQLRQSYWGEDQTGIGYLKLYALDGTLLVSKAITVVLQKSIKVFDNTFDSSFE